MDLDRTREAFEREGVNQETVNLRYENHKQKVQNTLKAVYELKLDMSTLLFHL